MQATTLLAIAGLLLGADACYLSCESGDEFVIGMGMDYVQCPGFQAWVRAGDGNADIVHFDGGRASTCADSEGIDLWNIPQNVIGCENDVKGTCCGTHRC